MALEQRWNTIPPVLLTSNGTSLGLITIADTAGFHDKQIVHIQSNTVPSARYQIKRVVSATQMIVGPVNNKVNPNDFSNVSQFTTTDLATIGAVEQDKTALPPDKDHYSAIYESSPVNGDRVIQVDPYGNPYGQNNPLPVSGNITVATQKYDDVVITRDSDGDIVLVQKYLATVLMRTQQLFYDQNKDLIEVKDI